ncbi:MAG: cytochrome c3 family protein [Pyrinomonadaceae bacterium]
MESARHARGCAGCHVPVRRGVAETIPARLDAHRICYDCHAPGKSASNFSSCGSCHGLGRYSPTSTAARAYRVSFIHADHASRQRLTCNGCHIVKARGLRQGQQVTSISPVEHLVTTRGQTCQTCHNGQRAFGDKDTHNCKRCHRREGFRMAE